MIGSNFFHLVKYLSGLEDAQTKNTEAELQLLTIAARSALSIVELGVFEGVGSLCMRRAMPSEATLTLVDPFPNGRFGFCSQKLIAHSHVRKSRNGNIEWIRDFSYRAILNWDRKIDLVFWDAVVGDFDAADHDFRTWSPFLSENGLYLIHMSHDSEAMRVKEWLGAKRFVESIPASFPEFIIRGHVDTISIVTRRNASIPDAVQQLLQPTAPN